MLGERLSSCDICRLDKSCREIFVLKQILEEELKHAGDAAYTEEIGQLLSELDEAGFQYPRAPKFCLFVKEGRDPELLLRRMRDLLHELRGRLKISSL